MGIIVIVAILFILIGGLFAGAGIFNMRLIAICNHRIQGMYRGYNRVFTGKSGYVYLPIFEYQIAGMNIREQSRETVGKAKLEREFQEGGCYEIYINEKHPEMFIVTKRVHFRDIFVTLMGLLALGAGALVLVLLIIERLY